MSQMVTTCANCRQQLAVTAADLRVGQGYVRCGRCDKVFNALLTLAEDAPAPAEPESVAHGTRSVPMLQDDALAPPPGREDPIPFGSTDDEEDEVEVVQTHATGQFRSIVLDDDAADAGAEALPETDAGDTAAESANAPVENAADIAEAAAAAQLVREQVARDIILQATSQPIDVLLDEQRREGLAATVPAAELQADFDANAAVGNPPRTSPWWYVAAAVLLLALLAQFTHHNRHRLVGMPALAGPLKSVYGMFGASLDPSWDLRQYEVQELGAIAQGGASTQLVLQAAVAVKKDARWAQPPPVIRVVLSDRWGNSLATTDVDPGNWLLGGAPARIEPGQRLDGRLTLPAPQGVTGFALEPCLPDSAARLRCLHDAP